MTRARGSAGPWAGAAVGLLALATGVGWSRAAPRVRFGEGPLWEAAAALHDTFDLESFSTSLIVQGDVSSPEIGAALRVLERALEALPLDIELLTPFDVPGLRDAPWADVVAHPLVRDTLIVADGRGAFLPLRRAAEASSADPRHRDVAHELVTASRAALSGVEVTVEVLGTSAILEAQQEAFSRERWQFQVGGALLAFALASLAFRNARATLLAGLPPLVGVGFALGIVRLVGLGAAGFTGIVLPLLVLTIGFTDSLHLVVDAARRRRSGAARDGDAMDGAVRHLWRPCALTSLTTLIGFASLAATGGPIVRDFGLSCALATAVSFVTVVALLPLLARTGLGASLSRIRPSRFDQAELSGAMRPRATWVTTVVSSGIDSAIRHPRAWACAGTALALACALMASTLQLDRRASTDLARNGPMAQALTRVDRELGGVFPLYVRLDWDAETPPASVLAAARAARAALEAEPDVRPALGLDRLLEALPVPRDLPERDALGWSLLARLPAGWLAPVVDLERRRAVVHARVPDAGSARLIPAFARIRAELDAHAPGGVRLALVGEHVAYLETVTSVARDLAWSLALAAVLILGTLGVAFRSLRLGLASVVPNLLPVAASAAGLVVLGVGVDISALTALTLSLGIATDDTIHVLARWREERRAGLPTVDAARRAVQHTFPALALTSLTLIAAFAQLLVSDLDTIRTFGALAATTLAAAFVGDVWLLPAFLVWFTRSSR